MQHTQRPGKEEDLTALRWPRSSGGSFRSFTASITADRRSPSFFSVLEDLLDEEADDGDGEEEEEEEEEHMGLSPPRPTTADDLCIRDHDSGDLPIVLASRVAISACELKPLGLAKVSTRNWLSCFHVAFKRVCAWQQKWMPRCLKMIHQNPLKQNTRHHFRKASIKLGFSSFQIQN